MENLLDLLRSRGLQVGLFTQVVSRIQVPVQRLHGHGDAPLLEHDFLVAADQDVPNALLAILGCV
eukprot:CAMPEP_0181420060 /NCGR_PEP_ID=MMETSP1110-20121109/12391_1 /TAXON_ID=174948 /ORGANISM="Symbiodinium sp., Strain CCMP421" /LENGTH=64 /DNA_ID=CAMNT_0023543089 /DNA_START=214 /DNA_END=408 /DNA_ORIENTATION=-